MEKFDIVVIGGGPGGYPAAIRSAQLGAKTALVEKEFLGGTCLNWGCIPTKTLIASSDLFARMRHSASLGLDAGEASFDYAAMAKRKDSVVGTLRSGVTQLLKANGIKVFKGTGSFVSRNRVQVRTKGGRSGKNKDLEAGATIIATGSVSAMPSFIPSSRRIVDSRAFLGLSKLPARLIVLGGGVIGCEFACMAAQLGAEVTIVEMLEDILLVLDADLRRTLRRHMEGTLGIRVLTGSPLENIEAGRDGVEGRFEDETVRAEKMLVAVGRRPMVEGLKLENASISVTETGSIETDTSCRTRSATVYAIGDVTGRWQLAHAATSQGMTAAENAYRGERTPAETVIPSCIFTSPEIGSVGLSEQDAAAQGLKVVTGKFAFSALGKAMAAGETEGFVKWVADAETGRLLGAHAIGAHATELISEATAAVRAELTVEELGRTVHCHPTFSEAWMEAAHAVHGECIHAAPRRRRT
ncbi:MAG: dihydrolipoyl dehydrogenase [Lentisphaerae bacterium]|nr:dihydrolipoyl dehydrogenase [Lentisphaerota bacterium]